MEKQPVGLRHALFLSCPVHPSSQRYPPFLLITFRFDFIRNARRSLMTERE